MKTSSILLFLIVCSQVFGQSAKKLNKQLLTQFALEQQKQDSSFRVFTKAKQDYDSVKQLATEKIELLSDYERFCRESLLKNMDLKSQLKELGTPVTPEVSELPVLPNYRDFVRPLKNPMKTKVVFDKVSNRLYLELMNRREQNEALNAKIKEYGEYAKSNFNHLQELERSFQQISAFLPKLDSMTTVYERLGQTLKTTRMPLEGKIEALRENYIRKGPNGFPEAYRRIFPDAFPPPPMETIDVVIGSETVEGDFEGFEMVPPPPPPPVEKTPVYDYVDEPASFPGGTQAMLEFISKNLYYPQSMKDAGIQGKVFLKFVVSETGEISDIKVVRGLPDCKECDLAAVRVVKLMPKWIPGKINGKTVKSFYNLPVKFVLE